MKAWRAEPRTTPGRQRWYSPLAILTALTLRAVFRKAETLEVPRPGPRIDGEPLHLLVDSTGLKLCGAGEWMLEKHGTKTRRSWRKLRLGLDAGTGQIVAAALTGKEIDDGAEVGPLLDQMPGPLAWFTADGAYDQEGVAAAVAGRCPEAAIIVPPRSRAVPGETAATAPTQRDRYLRSIAEHGRAAWQKASGYTRRARAEAAIGRVATRRTRGGTVSTVQMSMSASTRRIGWARPKGVQKLTPRRQKVLFSTSNISKVKPKNQYDWNSVVSDINGVSPYAGTRRLPDSAPLFTVVMPCFHAADTITTSIASVLAQTEQRFELIVVDDGCPNGSAMAARTAIGNDPRGRVISQPNAGPAMARNRGAAVGSGRFLAFLDADDRWASGLLAAHRDHFATDPDVGISFGRLRFYDAALLNPGRCSAYHADVTLEHAMAENPCCSTSNLVVRRTTFVELGGFDLRLTHAEDQEFVVRALATSHWRVTGIDAELVHYRISTGGLSADLASMEQGWRSMVERARTYTSPAAFKAAEPQARALFSRYLARRALRTGQPATIALWHLWTAFRSHPGALFAWGPKRTLLTMAGVAAALLLPRRLIQSVVAR